MQIFLSIYTFGRSARVPSHFSHVRLFATAWTAACQPPCPSPTPRAYTNSCPLSRWCHPTISSSVAFLSCPQSFPAPESFPMSQLFTSGDQSIRASALASVLPMNIQGWLPLGLTDLISLQYKRLSRVFSSTTVWKHHSSMFSFLYGPSLTSIHWKNHGFD